MRIRSGFRVDTPYVLMTIRILRTPLHTLKRYWSHQSDKEMDYSRLDENRVSTMRTELAVMKKRFGEYQSCIVAAINLYT